MRRLLFFFLFAFSLSFGFYLNHLGQVREVFRSICDLTEDHFYRDDEKLLQWVHECHIRSAKVSPWISVERLLVEIQALMNELPVSHFQIYNPVEDRRMWKGEGVDSGIRSHYVEDHLVVY